MTGAARHQPVAALRGVSKTFANGTAALAGFDLAVAAGEFVALLGPSGCGKTTALRLIAGLTAPTAGSVSSVRSIGFVFQEPTLMPWATVAANVALPLQLAGAPPEAIRDRVGAMLDRVGLRPFANAYPRQLSGGMRMRVALARALVTEPVLLLLDEPFAALDEITRFKLNDDLLTLWRTLPTTVIFVTHSVFESIYLSQRIVVMTPRPGRVFDELAVEAPRARDAQFRTSAAYAAQCRAASEALAASMAGEGAA